jgi:hypothetical protein
MPIAPDDKDWTWVLRRACPECGFDAPAMAPERVATLLRTNAAAWVALLAGPVDALRRRPAEDRWAPVEYACHVRDVCVLYDERLALMLEHDDPLYPNWDQDATAVEACYLEQDPAAVAHALGAAAAALAARFDTVHGEAWARLGRRSDGAAFTVASFARYLLHDPVHHLFDVTGERAGATG